jgi:hypothetical protein
MRLMVAASEQGSMVRALAWTEGLPGQGRAGKMRSVQVTNGARATRSQATWGIAALGCYAVGYPLALVADQGLGWVLVMLGGVCLLGLGVVTIRRIHRGSDVSP